MIAVKLGYDYSRGVVSMANYFCLFNLHNVFRHSDRCVINFVHSTMTRTCSTVVGVIYTRLSIDELCWPHLDTYTPTTCRGVPWYTKFSTFSIHKIAFACDGIRQEVQVLRWTEANQLTEQAANGITGWATLGFALHLVIPAKAFARDYGITGVRLSVCLFVCLFVCLSVNTITK